MTLSSRQDTTKAAIEAYGRGYTPVPLKPGEKRPAVSQWSRLTYTSEAEVIGAFESDSVGGVGLSLGDASHGLVDVDLDHPKALRLAQLFLPPTPMMSGRASARRSHHWYVCSDDLPAGTRRYLMPDGSVSVELRSTGGQTVIPPSVHPSNEAYRWEGEPWGGEEGPRIERGKILSARVATLALACVIVDGWPKRGGRHEAYLALAGGLLRYGTGESITVHPLWEHALPNLIRAVAEATLDEDGPETRVEESMSSTLQRIHQGRNVQGFPTLSRILGEEHVRLIRDYAREIETILGHAARPTESPLTLDVAGEVETEVKPHEDLEDGYNPLDRRNSTWEPVDFAPYIAGKIPPIEPGILFRSDGVGLFYPGRVNSLYGRSESGKSWIAFAACKSAIDQGQRVLYVDCEDEPQQTLERLRLLGLGDDDVISNFSYIRPEDPIARLLINRWGESTATEPSRRNQEALNFALDQIKPDLIVVDGLTVLYGLHGLDTNAASDTEKITGWMKTLTANGRRTVILIDHTAKNASLGAAPMGSQHKVAMVQGSALQVHPITRPVPGRVGEVHIAVGKDRPGIIRKHSTDDDPAIAAKVTLDNRRESRLVLTIEPLKPTEMVIGDSAASTARLAARAKVGDRVLQVLADNAPTPMSVSEILLVLGRNAPSKSTLKRALVDLENSMKITLTGHGTSSKWKLHSTVMGNQ